MSMSDCEKCWETPCSCGWSYRNYNVEYIRKLSIVLNRIIEFKQSHPERVFSSTGEKETIHDVLLMRYIRRGKL